MTPPDGAGRWKAPLLAALLAGLVTGALTLAAQAVLPTDANRLANSGAIWVTVAFLVGWRTRSDVAAVAVGLITLLSALAGYFAGAFLANAPISASTVAIWVGVAVVGGPLFGLAGRWRGAAAGWRPVLAAALLGAVYVAEGAWTLLAIPHMTLAGWVSVVLGVAITLLLPANRKERLGALILLVPLTLLGLASYSAIDAVFRRL